MRWARLLSAICLLVCSVQASAEPTFRSIVATEAQVDGRGEMVARLSGAILENGTLAGHPFEIVVTRADLELDEMVTEAYSQGIGVTPIKHSTSHDALENVTITSFKLQQESRILVIPSGVADMALEADGLGLAASRIADFTYPRRASAQEPGLGMATSEAIQVVTHGSETNMQIRGPFIVAIWGADFVIEDHGGAQRNVTTGQFDEPWGPSALPPAVASKHVSREAIVAVDSGNLTLSLDSTFQVFLSQPRIDLVEGGIQLRNPKGIDPVDGSSIPVGSRELRVFGPTTIGVAPAEGGIEVTFAAPPTEAILDGTAIRAPGSNSWSFPIALLSLVALPAAAVAYSRLQFQRRIRSLGSLVASRRFDQALVVARAIRRRRPRHPDALVAETVSLLNVGRFREAGAVLESNGWTAALGPMRDYLRANSAAGMGRTADAVQWLAACLRDAPDMWSDAASDPRLAGLLAQAEALRRKGPPV